MNFRLHLSILFGIAIISSPESRAAEAFPTNALLLHLDAGKQAGLRAAAALPPVGNGTQIDRWLTSAGATAGAFQPLAAARPIFRTNGREAFLRFDAKDDHFTFSNSRRFAKELTVFVLTAPRANPGLFSGMFGTAVARHERHEP